MANLNVSIDKVVWMSMVHPASSLDFFKLLRKPARVSPLRIIPDQDYTVDLKGRPDLDFRLAGNLSIWIGYLDAVARLSVILPAMEWTLDAFASDLMKSHLEHYYWHSRKF